jgi:hypothetical protein
MGWVFSARRETYTGFWWENLRERDTDRRIILRWIFRKLDVWVWPGLRRFGIGTGGVHL